MADGATVTIQGVLTTDLGALEGGRTVFVQDPSGGIALYLDAAATGAGGIGTWIRVTGTIDTRFSQRTLRVSLAAVEALGVSPLPAPILTSTGAIGESVEGARVAMTGTVVEAPSSLSDGTGLLIDDGSGPVRIVVTPAALSDLAVARTSIVSVVGPAGQRDSTGAGTVGYRVFATAPGELTIVPAATPVPSATPGPTPGPTPAPTIDPGSSPSPTFGPTPTPVPAPSQSATPTAHPSPSATPIPGPTPTPAADPVVAIGDVRAMATGAHVHVRGVVTAEPGRLGSSALVAIADSTGALVVHLPAGATAPGRGALVDASGPLAAPYGQLEVRPTRAGFAIAGTASLPVPIRLTALDLGESVEARLVTIDVQLDQGPHAAATGDVTTSVMDIATGRRITVMADASSLVRTSDLAHGRLLRLLVSSASAPRESGAWMDTVYGFAIRPTSPP